MKVIFSVAIAVVLFSTSALADSIKPEAYRIGWIGPLTGHAAVLGVDALTAVQIAFKEFNSDPEYKGPRLELVVEDDQYVTGKTINAYNSLVQQRGIKLIFIYGYSGLFALAPKAQKDGVVLLDPLDCDEDIAKLPKNVICVAKRTEDMGYLAAQHAVKNSKLPAGVVFFENDAFPLKMAESTREKLEELGHKVDFYHGYQSDMKDFRSLLLKARQKRLKALFAYGYNELGILLKQAKEIGLDAQIYTLSNVAAPAIMNVAASATEGVMFPNWKAHRSEIFASFIKKFVARQGKTPTLEVSTIPSYDMARILGLAMAKAKNTGVKSSEMHVRDYFYGLKDYEGASGTVTVDRDGITRSFAIVMQIIRGDRVEDLQD